MRSSRAVPAALIVGTFAITSVFIATPAVAATLPSGQQITVIDAFEWQFYDASPEDAALTPVGSTGLLLPFNTTIEGVDVDDDGYGFALSTEWELDEESNEQECAFGQWDGCWWWPTSASVFRADANTGELTDGIQITILTGPLDEPSWADADSCFAIDYTDGVITAACNIYGNGDNIEDSAWIGELDPDTGRLYPHTLLYGDDFVEFQAIARSPIDGTLWGFDYYSAYILVAGEEADYIGSVAMSIWAADFDRDGKLWVSAYRPDLNLQRAIEPGEEGLAILNLDDGTFDFDAAWSDPEVVINALTVWGKPVLPATGAGDSAPIAVTAAGLLMLGSLVAAGAMLRRRYTSGVRP